MDGDGAVMNFASIVSGVQKSRLFPLYARVACINGLQKYNRDGKILSEDTLNENIRFYMLWYKQHEPSEAVFKGGFVCPKAGIELTRADERKPVAELETAHKPTGKKESWRIH